MTTITHPNMIGTDAADCAVCYATTYAVALDCAYDNLQDAGEDSTDSELAASWARLYVETGTVSAYYCHRHDH